MQVSPLEAPVSVVIASKGRPEILGETLASVRRQTRQPRSIIVVVPAPGDLPGNVAEFGVETIVGPAGLARQRNAGIRAVPETTPYVAFFDDDFEPRDDYLERAIAFLARNPTVVGMSGLELGGTRPHSRELACRMIAEHAPDESGAFYDRGRHFILYGCNMVLRRAALALEEFDENLPLYAYGEDYEITMRLLRHGRIGRYHRCIGVHLLTTGGRINEVQRGYSQVANNWYFLRKGTVHLPAPWAAIRFWSICVGKTIWVATLHVARQDRSADWTGRLRGYLLAVRDILTGRSDPRRILEL